MFNLEEKGKGKRSGEKKKKDMWDFNTFLTCGGAFRDNTCVTSNV